jgi:hypothetical protein
LGLAGLPRILAEPDADPLAILRRRVEQTSLGVARICSRTHHIEKPIEEGTFATLKTLLRELIEPKSQRASWPTCLQGLSRA